MQGMFCPVCSERLHQFAGEAPQAQQPCGMCRRAAPPFERLAAYGSYDGHLRALLHLLKYDGVQPALPVLGKLLAQAIRKLEMGAAAWYVVPVPLFHGKRHQRGFNQAELLARAALRHLPGDLILDTKSLERSRATVSQTGLTRHQRRENLRGAFRVQHAERVKGQTVLLIDDVCTTGTTVSECARVLRRAGAKQVFVATVARVLKGEIRPAVFRQAPERDADRREDF